MTGVAVVLALGGGGYLLAGAGASTPTGGVAAAGPVPAAASLHAVPAPPPSAVTVVAPASVETLPLDASDTPERKPARAQRLSGPVAKLPPAAPAGIAQPAPAPAPVTATSVVSAAPPVGSASAWDRGAFGGRH